MAGHTVINLKEVEDLAPKFGFSPGLESRFARVPLELENSGISYFRIARTFANPSGTGMGCRKKSMFSSAVVPG